MKQFCMMALAGLLVVGCQEVPKGYVINGEVENMPDGKIYLKSFRNKMFFDVDTAEVKDGKFTFKGEVDQPLLFGLATENMNYPVQLFQQLHIQEKKKELNLHQGLIFIVKIT